MEWKIELRHKEMPWEIEIVGIGKDPHKPDEVVIKPNVKVPQIKKLIESIKSVVADPPAFLASDLKQSKNDMYLWRFATWKAGKEWEIKDNLPELKLQEEEIEEERRGITVLY